jgi:hypothetical protein
MGGKPMTLQLTLPAQLENRLRQEAERQGLSADALTLRLLDKHLPLPDHRAQTVALLQSWIEGEDDEADQDYDLFHALDEARTSDRKLFPDELKGRSW